MKYEQMTREQKRGYVDEFVKICEDSTETEIRILYQNDSHFRLIHSITQKFFVEYFVEPIIEKLKPFLELVAKMKKELQEDYLKAIQSNLVLFGNIANTQTMSLGS